MLAGKLLIEQMVASLLAFADEAALEARANELGLRCILVTVINGRKGAAVAQA